MRKSFAVISCAILVSAPLSLLGQGTANLKARQWNDPYLAVGNKTSSAYTPTATLLTPYYSYSSAAASFDLREEGSGAYIPEEGNALRQGRFDAESFLRLKGNSAVSGRVGYRRAVKQDVALNETSDYELLRPYVLIDTVGGNLQHEQYSFQGAWMQRSDKLVYSVYGGYKAVHEYRSVDPRPRNISSDFKADASLGYVFPKGSVISYAGYRKYHQRQDVTFMSNTGANTTLFHSTGLGADYYRFRSTGVFAATRYEGHGLEAGIVGSGASGKLHCGLSYGLLGVTRHLSNQNDAPLSTLETESINSFVSYRVSNSFAVEAKMDYEKRTGCENVIDCAASGIYDDILSLDMYSQGLVNASALGVFRVKKRYGIWYLMPSVRWRQSSEEYRYPSSWMKYSVLAGRFSGGFSAIRGSWLYDLTGGFEFGGCLYDDCTLQTGEERIRDAYLDKFERRTKNYIQGHAAALAQKEISGTVAVFSRVSVGGMFYGQDSRMLALTISIGISY
ncbi:MAG TPA: hypothetical protein DD383_02335 [Rikenellaceae bacterium]|nr:hypothetical protein [Rikenellaceae bacterium]